MPRITRYRTEIRGDGHTQTWMLPHRLAEPHPAVRVRDMAGAPMRDAVRITYPSASEVRVTFRRIPAAGARYSIELRTL